MGDFSSKDFDLDAQQRKARGQAPGAAAKRARGAGGAGGEGRKVVPLASKLNRTEQAYAAHLAVLALSGRIRGFRVLPARLRLADDCTYEPDFLVWLADGRLRFDEVKGFLQEDARVKFRQAVELFPMFEFLMVARHKQGWKTLLKTEGASQ